MMRTVEYQDQIEGFRGWLVYDGTDCRLAAGGCRVCPGLTAELLQALASRMTLKQRLLGSNVDGAKCGIDYDPRGPGKSAAIARFLSFLKAELLDRFSMGCDMGTQFDELEALARSHGIPSIKYAIARAQELSEQEYFARIALLSAPVGRLSLGQRRAGHALAHAAVVAAGEVRPNRQVSCALQGFGTLGRAAAYSLSEAGIRIVAISDEFGYAANPAGLDVERMLQAPFGTPVRIIAGAPRSGPAEELFDLEVDMFVLAAGENSLSLSQVDRLQAPIVVVGSNCGLTVEAEFALHSRGILVVPDFVGGIGGSASMEALFGPAHRPEPADVLHGVGRIMQQLLERVIAEARTEGKPPRAIANRLAASTMVFADDRPYGTGPYLSSTRPSTAFAQTRR